MFSFRNVDHRTHPFLRGIPALSSSLPSREAQDSKSPFVCGVCVIPGHFALLLHSSTTICLFDAVPTSFRLADSDTHKLSDVLTKRQQGSVPDILLSVHPVSIIRFFFEKGPPLRFVAVQSDGTVFTWEWLSNDWIWCPLAKFNVSSSAGFSGAGRIQDASFFPSGAADMSSSSVVWLEQNILYSRTVHLPKPDAARTKHIADLAIGPAVVITSVSDSTGRFTLGRNGLWIVASDSIHFYSSRTQSSVSIPVEQWAAKESMKISLEIAKIGPVLATTCHNVTSELVVLDRFGRVFVMAPDSTNRAITVVPVSVIQSFTDHYDSSPSKQTRIEMFCHYHTLALLQDSSCRIYDIQCGELVTETTIPTRDTARVWEVSPGFPSCPNGAFTSVDILEFRTPPVAKQAEILSRHGIPSSGMSASNLVPSRPVTGCAVPVARDWGLERWEAKYLLDVALSHKDEFVKRAASAQLQPSLESPAMTLALLSPTQSHHFITVQIQAFLSRFHGESTTGSGLGVDIKAQDAGQTNTQSQSQEANNLRTSFMYHTPLNKKIVPLLERFLKISLEEEKTTSEISAVPSIPDLEFLHPMELLDADADVWEAFANQSRKTFLKKMEEPLGLKGIEALQAAGIANLPTQFQLHPRLYDQEETLMKPDSSVRKVPAFELLVRLYFEENAEILSFFVKLVTVCFEKEKERELQAMNRSPPGSRLEPSKIKFQGKMLSFYTRALDSLPPPSTDQSDEKIMARFALLCANGNSADAMRLLLATSRWDNALVFARSEMDHDVEHFVLFQILITHCLKTRNLAQLQQIWDLMPHGFGIFDLLALIKHYLPPSSDTRLGASALSGTPSKVLSDNEEEMFVVEVFRPQLLKMWNASLEKSI